MFKSGDKVECLVAGDYFMTVGKEYEVLEYSAPEVTPHFTWPAYVVFKDDRGKISKA